MTVNSRLNANSPVLLSTIVMISFYVLSKRFFLKRKGLSHEKVASITKKKYDFAVLFALYSSIFFKYHPYNLGI